MCRYANVRVGATCFTCEYTTVPRMLSRSATANDSTVNRNVIANTRAGIPIQRGPPELVFAMLLSYTSTQTSVQSIATGHFRHCFCAHTLQYSHVASRLGDHPQPRGDRAKQPGFTGAQWHLLRPLGRDYHY